MQTMRGTTLRVSGPATRSALRYFYKPKPLRTLEEIRTDILALEKETEGLLVEIIGESPR